MWIMVERNNSPGRNNNLEALCLNNTISKYKAKILQQKWTTCR